MKKITILVFEYITGGGFNKVRLPESLAREGMLMLRALLDDLARIEQIETLCMLDCRLANVEGIPGKKHLVTPGQDSHEEFVRLFSLCDAVWPVAPESDGILQGLCQAVERAEKILLTSPADAVELAGNKWLTYRCLIENSIPTVPTQKLSDYSYETGEWLLKLIDGVGGEASYLVNDEAEFTVKTKVLNKENYLIQPHLQGEKTSLSCLFKKGKGWLLCANRQHFNIVEQQYRLAGVSVNFSPDTSRYLDLVESVAQAMPNLWGYAGIDLIETATEHLVLEINPRLTTSYAGIYPATGINCANAILGLLDGDALLKAAHHQVVFLNLAAELP